MENLSTYFMTKTLLLLFQIENTKTSLHVQCNIIKLANILNVKSLQKIRIICTP